MKTGRVHATRGSDRRDNQQSEEQQHQQDHADLFMTASLEPSIGAAFRIPPSCRGLVTRRPRPRPGNHDRGSRA